MTGSGAVYHTAGVKRGESVAVFGVGGVGLSALAFAGFWYFTVSQYPDAPPVWELVPRGITPGLFMAAILILNRWLSQRLRRESVAP